MKFLIVYFSNTGNTKRVSELLKDKLSSLGEVKIKNVLTATPDIVTWADLVLIGSPIHGFIIFGQKFCTEARNFIHTVLPADLQQKKFLLFATYLFWPGKALQKVEKPIISKNGLLIGKFAEKRDRKDILVSRIHQAITTFVN